MLEQRLRVRRRRRRAGGWERAWRGRVAGGHQRGAAVAAGAVEQRGGLAKSRGHRGAEARAERRRQRELVPRLGAQRVGERGRSAGRARVTAQELVDRGELGADLRGLAAGALDPRVDLAARAARGVAGGVRRAAALQRRRGDLVQAGALGLRGRRAALLELGELRAEPLVAVLGQLLELGLERRDPLLAALVVAFVLPRLGLQRRQQRAPPRRAVRRATRRRARGLEPQPDPLGRRPRRVDARRPAPRARRRAPPAPPRPARAPRAAGELLPIASYACRAGAAAASAAASSSRATRASSPASVQRASSVWRSSRSCSSAASAWRFSGRSRARASRSTSSARSRLSCVRSSLSCARRRRLRCLPSPAASSISSRRSRGFEVTICLDPALRDDRVHLLAQPGVAQDLEHVDEPALRPVDPVLALAARGRAGARSRPRRRAGRPPRRRCRARPRPRPRSAPARRERRRRSRPASTARARPAATARPAPTARRR